LDRISSSRHRTFSFGELGLAGDFGTLCFVFPFLLCSSLFKLYLWRRSLLLPRPSFSRSSSVFDRGFTGGLVVFSFYACDGFFCVLSLKNRSACEVPSLGCPCDLVLLRSPVVNASGRMLPMPLFPFPLAYAVHRPFCPFPTFDVCSIYRLPSSVFFLRFFCAVLPLRSGLLIRFFSSRLWESSFFWRAFPSRRGHFNLSSLSGRSTPFF